jgi:hypothetical protein
MLIVSGKYHNYQNGTVSIQLTKLGFKLLMCKRGLHSTQYTTKLIIFLHKSAAL